MWFLGVVFGVVITMVRRHRDSTNPHRTQPAKPTETDSLGMAEERDQEPDLPAWQADLFRQMDALAARVEAGAPAKPTERGGWRAMFQRSDQKPRFGVARDGYDRDQVDSVVARYERRFDDTRAQLERTELNLDEANSRVRDLEARVLELEEWGVGGSALPELADELLDKAQEIGREFRSYVLSRAEAETKEAKQSTEALESARARAEEIVFGAHRHRDEIARAVEESRRQLDQYLQEGRNTAEQRSRAAWEATQGRLREPVLELEHLNEQRRAMLKEVLELQESLDTSWRRVVSE